LPSLVAIVSIILDRFEWSGNWVVITPNLPSFAPHFNSCRAGSVVSMSTTTAQGHPSRGPPVNVGLHLGDKIGRCKTTPHNRWTNIAWILMIKRTCYLHLHYCVLLARKTIYFWNGFLKIHHMQQQLVNQTQAFYSSARKESTSLNNNL
jgi:hypothetical protein